MEEIYHRKVQTSVTNFIYHGNEYLMLLRNPHKRIDPNRLNGIGGRVESGENYLDAVIRETEEETGYKISIKDITFAGMVRLEGGYTEDWIMCFFKTHVVSKDIPHGHKTEDGELLWIHKDEVLDSIHELVDDLNYCFKDIVAGDSVFFMNAKVNELHKIYDFNMTKLNR
ncbi:MAG: 7,8-dihydro-8-oxoguanine triphosphatase [Parcubacteria group bacterium Gr01-1014_66]|nr:MAG: 7,8-dihydro-8-oxoguanine triphosphatase [Parcubacteria group bacterium Gr01-1014_66]